MKKMSMKLPIILGTILVMLACDNFASAQLFRRRIIYVTPPPVIINNQNQSFYYERVYQNGYYVLRRVEINPAPVVEQNTNVQQETNVSTDITLKVTVDTKDGTGVTAEADAKTKVNSKTSTKNKTVVKPQPVKPVTPIKAPTKPEKNPESVKASEPEKQTSSAVPSFQVVILDNYRDQLRLLIETEGTKSTEKELAETIKTMVAGLVENKVAAVFTRGDADLRLVIKPTLNQIDKSGEYFRINSRTKLEIKDAYGNQIYGTREVSVKGVRTLGESEAIHNLSEPTAQESAQWCNEKLAKISEDELDIVVLRIELIKSAGQEDSDETVNIKIKAISDKLAKLPGLVRHDFTGVDTEQNICEFRLVYFKNSHPAGIMNSVGALLKELTKLK